MKSAKPLLAVVLAAWPLFAHADIVVDEFIEIHRYEIGKRQFVLFKAEVTNTGTPMKRVRGTVVSTDPDILIFRKRLRFGRIGALASHISKNAFLVVAPRGMHIDCDTLREVLDIDYRFRLSLTLTAQVVDDPIPNATVTASVAGAPGAPVIADGSGNFAVDVTLSSFDEFVALDAVGAPGQEFVELTSLVGSGQELHDATAATAGSPQLSPDEVQTLDVTHVSTAKAVLAEAAIGAPVASHEDLAAAESMIDTPELINVAAMIKTVIDNDTVDLPPGSPTTLALAQDANATDAFIADLQANNADLFNAAVSATLIGAPSGGFNAGDVDEPIYSNILRNLGVIVGERLMFNADGSAQRTGSTGTFDGMWNMRADGVLELQPVGEVVQAEFFSISPACTPAGSSQVRTQNIYAGSEFRMLQRGAAVDLVTERVSTFQRFPDNPECVDTAPEFSEPFTAFRWTEESGTSDYTAADFAGRELILNFWSTTETRPPEGNAVRNSGQDFFTFAGDGTGTTRITGRDFNWIIDADGHLEIAMTSGEFNEYVSLGPDIDGDIDTAINIGTTANGVFAFRSLQIGVNPAFVFSPGNFVGPTFISGAAEQSTLFPSGPTITNYAFNADGSWSRNGAPPFGDPAAMWSNPAGRLHFSVTAFGFSFQEIAWTAAAILGDRYWVLEARQLGNAATGNFVDLGTTTGFLTYYRVVP